MGTCKYRVSIIMPVYNVEIFIREAIDSIIAQDIGLEHIQLILVDDGSPDGSGTICDEYAAQYPDNIFVVHKENGGLSSARNAGLEYAQAEFVNFTDPDDKLAPNVISSVCKFYEEYGDKTDVVSIPLKFFDARTGDHILNYKYKNGTRLVNLKEECNCPQMQIASSFIRTTCFEHLRFDTRLTTAEDAQVLQRILLKKCTLGVVSNTAYWYRKRSSGAPSLIQDSLNNKRNYIPYMKYFMLDAINYSLETQGTVPRFVQHTLMYALHYRLKSDTIPEGLLSAAEKEEYLSLIREVLQHIEDEVIAAQRNIFQEHRLLAYKLKYGSTMTREVLSDDICFAIDGRPLIRTSQASIKLEFIRQQPDHCVIEGTWNLLPGLENPCEILVKDGDTFHKAEVYGTKAPLIRLDQVVLNYLTFRIRVPLEANQFHNLEFFCNTEGTMISLRNSTMGHFFPISNRYRNNFYAHGGWILTKANNKLCLKPKTYYSFLYHEAALCRELWKTRHPVARNSVLARLLLHILKPLCRKEIWLISDRADKAGDNGEAFFRYVRQNHPQIHAWFVINGSSPDYQTLKKIGPVVKKNSYAHKMLHLLSTYVISSHADRDVFDPFYRNHEPYRTLLADDKSIFLQHGVTANDLSNWLRRSNKNFFGFVTSAYPEYNSICNDAYGYTGQQVWLTGFARFDRLYQDTQNWVTIMPTWRKYLMGKANLQEGKWSLSNEIEDSAYIRFYRDLLHSSRLHEAAKQYGYQLKFLPHPQLQPYLQLFGKNDAVEYFGREVEYRDIYAKSNLVLTDYSSAAFDFAYLRKPVIYTHFDAETFFSGAHVYTRGYFDYERDGFGEVEYTLEDTIDRIIEYMENGCVLKDKYRTRIDHFFAFNDRNNCQRIYEKILESQHR